MLTFDENEKYVREIVGYVNVPADSVSALLAQIDYLRAENARLEQRSTDLVDARDEARATGRDWRRFADELYETISEDWEDATPSYHLSDREIQEEIAVVLEAVCVCDNFEENADYCDCDETETEEGCADSAECNNGGFCVSLSFGFCDGTSVDTEEDDADAGYDDSRDGFQHPSSRERAYRNHPSNHKPASERSDEKEACEAARVRLAEEFGSIVNDLTQDARDTGVPLPFSDGDFVKDFKNDSKSVRNLHTRFRNLKGDDK